MTRVAPAAAPAIALGLLLIALPLPAATAESKSPPGNEAVRKDLRSEVEQKGTAAVQPEAVEALKRMSAYLSTLKTAEIKTDTTLDVVTTADQRIQVGGTAHYKIRRPDAFQIDLVSDVKNRKFYFDGKKFTVFAPELGFYATAPAPATIKEALAVIYDKFGVELPLADLFRWNDADTTDIDNLDSGFSVGGATVDGVATEHYAFREGDRDWEIWIQKGDKPLPRKLVIIDRDDDAHPTYVAHLSWTENPTLAASDFTFTPGSGAKAISFVGETK
jgi:hypothetical protein